MPDFAIPVPTLPEDALKIKAATAITEMGTQYLCHPANHVRRKTPMTTAAAIQRQKRALREQLIFGGGL